MTDDDVFRSKPDRIKQHQRQSLIHPRIALPCSCTHARTHTQWDGDLNQLKETVKDHIEAMAASWNADEKKECVDATAAAFRGGGRINAYLSGASQS